MGPLGSRRWGGLWGPYHPSGSLLPWGGCGLWGGHPLSTFPFKGDPPALGQHWGRTLGYSEVLGWGGPQVPLKCLEGAMGI